jgi:hypothetical protein
MLGALRFGIKADSSTQRKMLAENVNCASLGLQAEAFGHQKLALGPTLRLHNDDAPAESAHFVY